MFISKKDCRICGSPCAEAVLYEGALWKCFVETRLFRKMNGDRTDLAVGSYSHAWSPDSGSGSDNVVHAAFLKVATGIFPE